MPNLLTFLSFVALALVCSGAAPSKPTPVVAHGNRFLFVIDTSASMLKLQDAGRETAFDLIFTGINNQMQRGDTFGLWTFNAEVFGGIYPMQIWEPTRRMELASGAVQYLRAHPYEKKPLMDQMLNKVSALIKGVKDVNVLIVSSGAAIVDTRSLSAKLEPQSRKTAVAARKARKPVILALAARNGEIVSTSVTVADEPIRLPPPPVTVVRAAATNSPPPTAHMAPSSQAPTQSLSQARPRPPIIISKTNAASWTAAAPQAEQKLPASSELAPQPARQAEGPTPEQVDIAVSAETKSDSLSNSVSHMLTALAAPAIPVAARENSMETNAASGPPVAPLGTVTVPSTSVLGPITLGIAGLGLVAVAVAFFVVFTRRSRPTPGTSFISRSLDRNL